MGCKIVLAQKNDETLQFRVDYGKLNAVAKRDLSPTPRMDDCINSVCNAAVFSTLKDSSDYWHVETDETDREKTTFIFHHGLYWFICTPCGLQNTPDSFQHTVDVMLSTVRSEFSLLYLEDIVIFSISPREHIGHVQTVLALLHNAGVTLKLKIAGFSLKSTAWDTLSFSNVLKSRHIQQTP